MVLGHFGPFWVVMDHLNHLGWFGLVPHFSKSRG